MQQSSRLGGDSNFDRVAEHLWQSPLEEFYMLRRKWYVSSDQGNLIALYLKGRFPLWPGSWL
jgi:hypothetical protein